MQQDTLIRWQTIRDNMEDLSIKNGILYYFKVIMEDHNGDYLFLNCDWLKMLKYSLYLKKEKVKKYRTMTSRNTPRTTAGLHYSAHSSSLSFVTPQCYNHRLPFAPSSPPIVFTRGCVKTGHTLQDPQPSHAPSLSISDVSI